MINKLQKRDCDINIKLTPIGTFLRFEMDVHGDHFEFSPSSTVSEQFGAVVRALYALFDEYDDMHDECRFREFLTDENHIIHTVVTKVDWDNEGNDLQIIMSRKCNDDIDYETDLIDIELRNYDDVLKKYTVKTVDWCYAVAKACTQVLKEYGFYGYRYSTEYDYFKIHQLLYIKSVALENFEAREFVTNSENKWAMCSSFEKELELLMFDM